MHARIAPAVAVVARAALISLALASCKGTTTPCPTSTTSPTTTNGTEASSPPRYRAVHIDLLREGRFAQFENARKEWVSILGKVHGSDLRGAYFEMEHLGFLGIRPLQTFAELDARPALVSKAMENVPSSAGDAYDLASDTALVFPHTSEIWRLDDELAYRPESGALTETSAGFISLSMLEVKADKDSEALFYGASKEALGALAKAHYPLTRLTFETQYGSGRVYALWLAPTREVFADTPTVERALEAALGEGPAKALLERIASALVKETTIAVIRRRDLDSP